MTFLMSQAQSVSSFDAVFKNKHLRNYLYLIVREPPSHVLL